MSAKSRLLGVAMVMLALAACVKQPEAPPVAAQPPAPKPVIIPVVKPAERSSHYLAVSQQIELGGTLYAYADIDGDALKLAGFVRDITENIAASQPQAAPYLKQDYGALFKTLGLNDVKAIGLSSVPDGTGFFRNRVFLYTPDSRHGLLAGLGGKPGPFTHLHLAPADTDLYGETEVDLPVIYQTFKDVANRIAGEKTGDKMDSAIKQAGQQAAIKLLDLIYGLKGHASMVLRLDAQKTLRIPGPTPVTIPQISLLLCVDGIGPSLEGALIQSKAFQVTTVGNAKYYELMVPLPLEGVKPIFAIEGSTLYLATSRSFLEECRGQKTGLADNVTFKQALAHVGTEGNGLSYVSARLFDRLGEIEKLNPDLPADTKNLIHFVTGHLPKVDRPLVTIRTNLPDGILVRAYWNRSLKQDVAILAVYNPVTIGFFSAMAIPAFQKVRASSQQKTVLNNLRQLAAAADQYYLENGVSTATYDDLVGPNKYIRHLQSVDGEDYRTVVIKQGEIMRVRLKDGRVIEYNPN